MKIRFLIRHVFLARSARGGDGGLVKITWQIGDRCDIRRAARVSPLVTVAQRCRTKRKRYRGGPLVAAKRRSRVNSPLRFGDRAKFMVPPAF